MSHYMGRYGRKTLAAMLMVGLLAAMPLSGARAAAPPSGTVPADGSPLVYHGGPFSTSNQTG